MSTKQLLLALTLPALLLLPSCGGDGAKEAAPVSLDVQATDTQGVKDAKTAWKTLCTTCHGANGLGDGAAAAAFPVKPRSFGDKTWQASVDDAHIKKIIVEGGAAVGKSALMTGAPHLKGNDEALDYLVRIVRSFGN
ncbi:MAG: c-type cytochrome [Planctomycetota bacterium]|jgi:cytochrome c